MGVPTEPRCTRSKISGGTSQTVWREISGQNPTPSKLGRLSTSTERLRVLEGEAWQTPLSIALPTLEGTLDYAATGSVVKLVCEVCVSQKIYLSGFNARVWKSFGTIVCLKIFRASLKRTESSLVTALIGTTARRFPFAVLASCVAARG